jgi:hypothetical protein
VKGVGRRAGGVQEVRRRGIRKGGTWVHCSGEWGTSFGGLLGAGFADAGAAITITQVRPACRGGGGPHCRAAAAADAHRGLRNWAREIVLRRERCGIREVVRRAWSAAVRTARLSKNV